VPKLAEIQVFRPGQKDLIKPLRKASTLSIARNPKDGSFYVKDEILIRLKPGADPSELLKLLQETGGILVGSYPGLGIYKVRLPQGSEFRAVAEIGGRYRTANQITSGSRRELGSPAPCVMPDPARGTPVAVSDWGWG
jgi:hypothetical protein